MTIIDFIDIFRNARVYVKGSMPERTRLYRMGINRFLSEITEIVDVFGYYNNEWKSFEKNINYLAFMVRRKEFVILKEPNDIYLTSSQENTKTQKRVYDDITVDGPDLADENTDPVVLRKMKEIRELLEKSPFPEELLRRE